MKQPGAPANDLPGKWYSASTILGKKRVSLETVSRLPAYQRNIKRRLAASGSRCTCFSKRKSVATNVPAVESVCLSSAGTVQHCATWNWDEFKRVSHTFSYCRQASPFTFSKCLHQISSIIRHEAIGFSNHFWGIHPPKVRRATAWYTKTAGHV